MAPESPAGNVPIDLGAVQAEQQLEPRLEGSALLQAIRNQVLRSNASALAVVLLRRFLSLAKFMTTVFIIAGIQIPCSLCA